MSTIAANWLVFGLIFRFLDATGNADGGGSTDRLCPAATGGTPSTVSDAATVVAALALSGGRRPFSHRDTVRVRVCVCVCA